MTAQNDQFRAQVRKFRKRIRENSERAWRGFAFNVAREIVMRSPVDLGRFRGNWNVQFDTSPQTSEGLDRDGGPTLQRIASQLAGYKSGKRFWLLNHLPYSIPLEYGHSRQAPQGMVRLTVQRARPLMREAVRGLRT